MYITSTAHIKYWTILHVAGPVTQSPASHLTAYPPTRPFTTPIERCSGRPQPGSVVHVAPAAPPTSERPAQRPSVRASHIGCSWTDATRSHSLCGALTGDRPASVVERQEGMNATRRICGCFLWVFEKEDWGVGANQARRQTRGRDGKRRTESRTKKQYCFVLLLSLCDVAATPGERGFVAAVVDGKVCSRRPEGLRRE